MSKHVLFVCTENANRSQMAEAFARHEGAGLVEATSAGSRPSGVVNPRAVAAMASLGIDLGAHRSKGLDALPRRTWDVLVTMGCGDACPHVPAHQREDWALPDPRDMPADDFAVVRDEIRRRVRDLVARLRA